MIGLSTVIADANGDLIIYEDEDSRIDEATARVTKTLTLDGGVLIDYQGFFPADIDMEVKAAVDESVESKLKGIKDDHIYLIVSTRIGLYLAVMSRLFFDSGNVTIKFLIKERYAN